MFEVVQIVRRFGKDGGMERYVWELSHALANQNVKVHILCEEVTDKVNHHNISVNCLDIVTKRPRWLAMLRFSYKVSSWFKNKSSSDYIVHSHERTSVHQVTTFHGPPFANILNKPFWRRLSLRVNIWLFLEKRELCSDQVKVVLPNSDLILKDLKLFYPCIKERMLPPAYPGVGDLNIKSKNLENRKNIILFIGKEWKRKGLKFSIEIVEKMRALDDSIEFWVLGPKTQSIKHLFKNWKDGYKLLGWNDPKKHLPKARLLIHPAISEPYGMVISEATNYGVPVVISNKCGIAGQVSYKSGKVLSLSDNIQSWTAACFEQINRVDKVTLVGSSWKNLALEHVKIYKSLQQ